MPSYKSVPKKWKHVGKEWGSWNSIISRCYYDKHKSFKYYGARGISVCERWRNSFANFLEDVGLAPSPHHTIDRIDNSQGYTPTNCRWATVVEQARNRPDNFIISCNGQNLCLSEWAVKKGLKKTTLFCRIKRGWNEIDALTTPARKYNRYTHSA